MVNITGDAFGSGIVEHLSRDDLMLMDHVANEDENTFALADRYNTKDPDAVVDGESVWIESSFRRFFIFLASLSSQALKGQGERW